MSLEQVIYVGAILVCALVVWLYWRRCCQNAQQAQEKLSKAVSDGLTEPVSLHPEIDAQSCICAGACLGACPEGGIIGIVNGKAELVSPTKCIGHGACLDACPVGAITLVFGTARRGVDIPMVKETFETNVPGIYIAGELGGMGLIRNAVTQGQQAMDYIVKSGRRSNNGIYDVAIVGAGPAGLAATLQAKKLGLNYVTLEQEDVGGAALSYPRQKLVMTAPMEIPLYGKVKFKEIIKEDLLGLWDEVIAKAGIEVQVEEKVEDVRRANGHFEVVTGKSTYGAMNVLLAIGRRGTPRKLGVSGERSSKVAYKLIEPEQYKGMKLLVVGGGNSAAEGALALAEQEGTEVTLACRGKALEAANAENREKVQRAVDAGWLRFIPECGVKEIQDEIVLIEKLNNPDEIIAIENQFVFAFIGGILPTGFLNQIGIEVATKYGER